MHKLTDYRCPLVAILRGLTTDDATTVGAILFEAGFRLIEVPLNREGACAAITSLKRIAPSDAMVGGGTVLKPEDVDAVAEAGGEFIVSPNCVPAVIRQATDRGMLALPGVCTPTEAFAALDAGASGLKIFPAEMIPPSVVKAWRSVLPQDVYLIPVGGIHPNNIAAYVDAGASGFGIGGQLYRPGVDPSTLRRAAEAFMSARQPLLPSH
ncbi:MAG: 2-dehydro-3-deoxy-6-phosphogalactonate aldolase [Paucimonas sp.]|jgi:2-dehydro-3-deoxyphosphogalactonate aldolase|nr:2-dehydro-3-deoxy-6-phosphogalactonate aldolase [Paucimonas sp.]